MKKNRYSCKEKYILEYHTPGVYEGWSYWRAFEKLGEALDYMETVKEQYACKEYRIYNNETGNLVTMNKEEVEKVETKKPLQVQFIGGPLDGTELDPSTGETTDRYAIERTANCNDGIPEGYHHHYQMILEWSGTDLIYLGVKENGFKYSKKSV